MREKISRYVYIGELVDIYGNFFDERTKNILEKYYFENISCNEIAEEYSLSKQRVHKIIKNAEKKMLFLENRLGFLEFFREILKLCRKYEDKNPDIINELKKIIQNKRENLKDV